MITLEELRKLKGLPDLTSRLYLGQPILMTSGLGNKVYGRIVGMEGIELIEGVFSILFFSTPSGTVIKTGRAYVQFPDEGDDTKLAEFEELADKSVEGMSEKYAKAKAEWESRIRG